MSYINETDSQFIYSNLLILDLQNKLYPGGLLNPRKKVGIWDSSKKRIILVFSHTHNKQLTCLMMLNVAPFSLSVSVCQTLVEVKASCRISLLFTG